MAGFHNRGIRFTAPFVNSTPDRLEGLGLFGFNVSPAPGFLIGGASLLVADIVPGTVFFVEEDVGTTPTGIPIRLKQVAQLLREGGGHGRRRPKWHRL
jgi:hypothetical protein